MNREEWNLCNGKSWIKQQVYKHICEYNKLEIDFSLFTLNESNANYVCICIVVLILQIF